MNSTIPRALPSLAHPIIVNPALEVEWNEKPIHLPPFSDINLNWPGFTLSHLHWVGIHEAIIEAEEWELYLIVTHEGYHRSLANTPFSRRQAFIDIISYLLKNSSDNDYCSIADLSLEDAYIFFVVCFDRLDPDDSVYKRGGLTKLLESVDKNVNSVEENGEFTEFLFSKPNAILCTKYNSHGIQAFLKAIKNGLFETQEVMPGNEAIVLEAILQQLIKGKGLLCPFWNPPHGCCSRKNRALLEKVWSCTKPDAPCDWKQMGCLAKGAIV